MITRALLIPAFLFLCLALPSTALAGGNGITVVVSNTNDAGAGSLRQALIDTNANASPNRFNVVEITTTGTISLQTALPSSTQAIALRGPGADQLTIERGVAAAFRILQINGNNSLVEGLTIKNGDGGLSSGGGIFVGGNNSAMRGCVVTGSKAADGGGIFWGGSNGVIADCEITGNTASNDGGGVGFFGAGTVFNSTISGNTATNRGGGIFLNTGMSGVLHCTLSGNTAQDGGGMFLGSVTVTSTISADNTATGTGPDLNSTTATVTFSLVKDASGSNVVDGTNNNKVADPQLGTLASNGGPSKTMAIPASSPATDAGTSASVGVGLRIQGPECFDQRGPGFPRFFGSAPDMGAYELKSGGTISATSLADSGSGSLREALTNANATTGFTTIDLSGLSGTISLSTALPQITEGVHFKGPGAATLTIERAGGPNFSVFDVNASRGFVVQFTGLTISKGSAGTSAGGGILCRDPNNAEPCLIVDGCVIKGNSAARGGGLGIDGGILLVRNSEVSGNSSTGTGGGIDVTQPLVGRELSVLQMENSTVSGNTSGGAGGGISLTGNLNRLRFVTVANNTAGGVGGGLSGGTSSNTLEIYSSIFADNSSGSGGADWNATSRQDFVRNNLVESANATVGLTDGVNGNVVGLDPGLGALELNSGTTKTHPITATSAASEAAFLFPQVTKDQRGFTRPTDKQDMGAFEIGGTAPPVTTTGNSGGGNVPLRGPGRNESVVIKKGDSDCSLTSPGQAPTHGLWFFALLSLLCCGLRRRG